MDNDGTMDTKEFKFKMDKIERYFSIGTFIIFFLSFAGKNSEYWTILLFILTALILAYYFKWYKKKPSYLIIEDEQITIHPPLFFKPQQIKKHEIKQIKVLDKKIKIDFGFEGINKSVYVHSNLLEENDWKQLTLILKQFEPMS
ncbi:MAG TPA: EbsA family protein [Ruminiclostridium sp.]